MKVITSLKTQKRNPSRVNVFIDDQYAFAVRLIDAAILKPGQQLSESEISRLKNEDESYNAHRTAIRFLSYRARSQKEIERHLVRKKFSPEIIGLTVDRLRDEKHLDDLKFARTWLNSRVQRKPASRSVLGFELKQKGVDAVVIKEVLIDFADNELARICAKKKLRLWGDLNRKDFKKKMLIHLKRRGFNYETSLAAYTYAESLIRPAAHPDS
ncbi:MAG: RecX family transcriptional regulator [Desulfobacterales bacterium]|jgi:regulatory protein